MSSIIKWIYKCRKCGRQYDVDEKMPMAENPSWIMQPVCKCGGALDLQRDEFQLDSGRELE